MSQHPPQNGYFFIFQSCALTGPQPGETWGLSYQPTSPPSPASMSEQEEVGESTGFDEDSDDKSEEDRTTKTRKKIEPLSLAT